MDDYRLYVDKALNLDQQQKRREVPSGKALGSFMSTYAAITSLFELKKVTKAHLISLGGSMSNLRKSESALGIFSDAFDETAERLAEGILALSLKNPPPAAHTLLKWWIELSVIVVVGLLELAKEAQKEIEDKNLRDELLLTLFFYCDYPKIYFKQMAEALEIEGPAKDNFIALFELLALFTALLSYSKEEEWLKADLIERLLPRIQNNLQKLKQGLDTSDLSAYLEQIDMALTRGENEALIQTCVDLLESIGYPQSALNSDLAEIKGLFARFKSAFLASKENKSIMMHMVG